MIIAIAIAGFAFGREAAHNQIVETLQGMIGQENAHAIQAMIQNASNKPKTGIISTVLGIIALIFGAGGVVGQLQASLNTIWGVTAKPGQGIWGIVHQRFISFAMILGIGFLLFGLPGSQRAGNGSNAIDGDFVRWNRLACPCT
jgi:membrane protein